LLNDIVIHKRANTIVATTTTTATSTTTTTTDDDAVGSRYELYPTMYWTNLDRSPNRRAYMEKMFHDKSERLRYAVMLLLLLLRWYLLACV